MKINIPPQKIKNHNINTLASQLSMMSKPTLNLGKPKLQFTEAKTAPVVNLGVGNTVPVVNLGLNNPTPIVNLGIPKTTPVVNLGVSNTAPVINLGVPKTEPIVDDNRYNNFSNIQTNGPLANEYKNYENQRDHIYDRPTTYIGTEVVSTVYRFLLNPETMKMEEKEILLIEGVERLFLEMMTNIGDNAEKSRRYRCNPGKAIITMDNKRIKGKNGGVVIPIEKNEKGQWIPFVIFGILLSSSNYDKTVVRLQAGTNGYGAKLINIFSTFFKIVICDSVRKLKYTQIWHNNMRIVEDPIIEPYTGSENSVELEYEMDFARFGMTEYTPEYFKLFMAYAVDISWTCKLPITFNSVNLNCQNVKEYAKLYYPDETKKIFHYEWPEQIPIMDHNNKILWINVEFEEKAGKRVPKDKSVVPIAELCLIDTPDNSSHISFANGMRTPMGGVHVDSALKAVSDLVLTYFNEPNKKGEKKIKLTLNDLKVHMSILLSVRVPDPQYKGQAKEYLSAPKTKFNIPEKLVKPMENWDMFHRLYFALEAKQFKEIAKSDGKKAKNVNIPKLEDANDAGSAKSAQTTLFLTEGDSALNYILKLIALLEGGRDKNGAFPLRGKGLNVMNATAKQIAENPEIIALKKILGLREGLDYTNPTNYKTLRYGQVIVVSDQDADGTHIRGLILCFFYSRFPTLLQIGFIKYMPTPLIRCVKGKQKMNFYSEDEYETWLHNTPGAKSWKSKYFKGLGTSTNEEILEDSKHIKIIQCVMDEKCSDNMKLAFDKNLADKRKKWLSEYVKADEMYNMSVEDISDYINKKLIKFSLIDRERSLPRFIDQLKNSLRKILWGCWSEWKFKTNKEDMKVSDFGSVVSKDTKYHYGPTSLYQAIIGMAQDITGVSNLPFFDDIGQFGTRYKGGKDPSAPRYIAVKPMWWLQYIFKAEDMPLLKLVLEEGKECEPEFFLPILPIGLFNGVIGIGTADSISLVSYNPLDLIEWYKDEINGIAHKNIIPWYKGFTGTIEVKNKNGPILNLANNEIEEEIELKTDIETLDDVKNELKREEKEELEAKKCRFTMITSGKLEIVNNVAIITELPIGKCPYDYSNFLKVLVEEGIITKFDNQCNEYEQTILFKVYGHKNPTLETLKLVKCKGMSNLVFLDNNNKPLRFDDVQVVLKTWYNVRLPYFEQRRLHKLKDLQEQLIQYDYKIKFYNAVLTGQIDLRSKKSEILAIITTMGIPSKIYTECKVSNISQEEIAEFQKEVEQCKEEVKYYTNVTANRLWLNDLDSFEKEYRKQVK